jgi:hypothetical protein
MADRYLKIVLTLIAIELGWIAVNQTMPRVQAQAQPAPTPVVIRGIDLQGARLLPVALVGTYRQVPPEYAQILERPTVAVQGVVSVNAAAPVRIITDRPIKVEADRPLKVESVPYTPAQKPGE